MGYVIYEHPISEWDEVVNRWVDSTVSYFQVYCDNCASLSVHVTPGEDNSCLIYGILFTTLLVPPLQIVGIPLWLFLIFTGRKIASLINKEAYLQCMTCGEKWRGIDGHARFINYEYDELPKELPKYDYYGDIQDL